MRNDTEQSEKQVYRVQGFTCTNCAGMFEKNVKNLPGVHDAQVNFGASKITVFGHTTAQDLEKAGAFENLKVTLQKQRIIEKKEPFWKGNWNVLLSALLMAAGYILVASYEEDALLPALAFGAASVIGGYGLFIKGIKNLLRLNFWKRLISR